MNKLLGKVHCVDCVELIPQFPDQAIDICISSPPYNINHTYDVYKDNKMHQEYIDWLCNIFKLLKPKMTVGGRICINIGDGYNGTIPTHSDIIQFMTKDLGYLVKSTIIWNKNQCSNRTSWGSWMSPSNPSFPTPFEFIIIFCNKTQKKDGNKEDITVTKDEFIRNSYSMWTFATEKNLKTLGHPASFPIELPIRLIQQLSYKNDVVFDPFAGIGTTCLAAEMLKRKWVGSELSEDYAKKANEKLRSYIDQTRIF